MTDGFGVVNVNADGDADITLINMEEFRIHGTGGDDTLNAGGSAATGTAFNFGVALHGGEGDDTTIGGASDTHGRAARQRHDDGRKFARQVLLLGR